MKRFSLLTAAALLASTPLFAMDGGGVSISGEANFGVKFKENDGGANAPNELQFHHEFDIKFSASGTTDGGIGFGGSVSIDNRESVSVGTTGAKAAMADRDLTVTAATITPAVGDITFPTEIPTAGTSAVLVSIESSADAVIKRNYQVTVKDGKISAIRTTDIDNDNPFVGAEGVFNVEIPGLAARTQAAAADIAAIVVVDGEPTVIVPGKESGWVVANGTLYQIGAGNDVMTSATPASFDPDASNKVDNHGEVYISMDMHKLTIGSDLDAADKLAGGLADPGFDGIGIDDEAERVWGKSAADVRYDGDFGVASVAISYGDNKGDAEWAAGFSFNVEPVTFGAGFDSNGVMSLGMGFSQGQISMNALYSTDSDWHEMDNEARTPTNAGENKASIDFKRANMPDLKNQAMGVDMTYQISDATSLVLVAAQHKQETARDYYKATANGEGLAVPPPDDNPTYTGNDSDLERVWKKSSTTVDAFGVGFSHDLGGGATLKAGAGSVDSNAVADLGITMKF